MRIIGVIPARFGSTRFPGKPLVSLKGRPILQWVVELVKASHELDDFYVATDHPEIQNLCEKLGVKYILTSESCQTGTDRICEALNKIPPADVVINIQGDEPLLPTSYIDLLAQEFKINPHLKMATLAHPIELEDLENKNAVKVLINQNQEAIYFSRFPMPFSREAAVTPISKSVQKHIGVYGYNTNFLSEFCKWPVSFLEKHESLEQLRALEKGVQIKVVSVPDSTRGIDTPQDLIFVERLLDEKK